MCCSFRDVMISKTLAFMRQLIIVELILLFGPLLLKLREARQKEAFYKITDFTLSHVLSHNSK